MADPPIDTGGCSVQQLSGLPGFARYRLQWLHENFALSFFHVPSSLDKALVEKPMFLQIGSFCPSNLSSGTALQQDFVICKVGWKHLMMNILAAVHWDSTLPNIFHLQWSCLPVKSILLIVRVLQLATLGEIISRLMLTFCLEKLWT